MRAPTAVVSLISVGRPGSWLLYSRCGVWDFHACTLYALCVTIGFQGVRCFLFFCALCSGRRRCVAPCGYIHSTGHRIELLVIGDLCGVIYLGKITNPPLSRRVRSAGVFAAGQICLCLMSKRNTKIHVFSSLNLHKCSTKSPFCDGSILSFTNSWKKSHKRKKKKKKSLPKDGGFT